MIAFNRVFDIKGLFLLLLLLVTALSVSAAEFTGQVAGDLYTYDGTDDRHVRPYLRFRGDLTAWRGENNQRLRFYTSLRWTTDLADKLPSDPQTYVYDLYAHLANVVTKSDLYIGRQFVYSAVGSSLLDGGRVRVRPVRYLDFDFFVGSSVSHEDPEQVRSISDNLVVGGRLTGRPGRTTKVGLHWLLKNRDGDPGYHRIGLDIGSYVGRFDLYGRGAYNIESRSLAEIMARAAYRYDKWYVSGEFNLREPSVPANSIFAIVDYDRYRIVRGEARYRAWRHISLIGQIHTEFATDDDTWRTGLGFGTPSYSLLWIHQTGYAGDNDGIRGHANVRIDKRWECYVTANLFQYRVQREQEDRSESYATTLGVRWRPVMGLSIRVEGQYLRNAVQKDDWRGFFRIARNFAFKGDSK
jgi:hypothetical protein